MVELTEAMRQFKKEALNESSYSYWTTPEILQLANILDKVLADRGLGGLADRLEDNDL